MTASHAHATWSADGPRSAALSGRTVALPAARELDGLKNSLERAGARVVRFAAPEVEDQRAVERWLVDLVEGRFDDVVFFTAQGVRMVCELARQLGREASVLRALGAVRIIAQGGRTARALSEFGLAASVTSRARDLESLFEVVARLDVRGRAVALQPRDSGDTAELVRWLVHAGAEVQAGHAALDPDGPLQKLIDGAAGAVDVLVVSSASEVAWLWDTAAAAGSTEAFRGALCRTSVLASEPAARALEERGVRTSPSPVRAFHPGVLASEVLRLFSSANERGPTSERPPGKQRVVVVGHGVASHAFCEWLARLDEKREYHVSVIGEEPFVAYDRERLTSYLASPDPESLRLAEPTNYERRGCRVYVATKAVRVDRSRREVITASGRAVPYDVLVLATGAEPLVPPVPGMEKPGVFAYRTLSHLDALRAAAQSSRAAAVIGGGLLGLEVAAALSGLGLATHVIEKAARLMPRELDAAGAEVLEEKVAASGIELHLGKSTSRVLGDRRVESLKFSDGARLDVDLVVLATGVRPCDELGRDAGLDVGEDGGVVVDDALRTSDPAIYAIGDCAVHRGRIYGLGEPGREMARALASRLAGAPVPFTGIAVSKRLRFPGIEVATIGDPLAGPEASRSIVYQDLVHGIYKKLTVSPNGEKLLGAILVGDVAPLSGLLGAARSGENLPAAVHELLFGRRAGPAPGVAGGSTDPRARALSTPAVP
jgi:NADPH-dependent 2,4-dienoyl-CoA reductase/sulfur reductase-like enzyme/uroporphyrinogen-III synthase